jgi:hypothetical protein
MFCIAHLTALQLFANNSDTSWVTKLFEPPRATHTIYISKDDLLFFNSIDESELKEKIIAYQLKGFTFNNSPLLQFDSHNQYKEIFEKIDQWKLLHANYQEDKTILESIVKSINGISITTDKIHVYLHLANAFRNLNHPGFNPLIEEINRIIIASDYNQREELYEQLGEFYSTQLLLSDALETYYKAMDISMNLGHQDDVAKTEMMIGDLFYKRSNEIYLRNAQRHYANAAGYYKEIDDLHGMHLAHLYEAKAKFKTSNNYLVDDSSYTIYAKLIRDAYEYLKANESEKPEKYNSAVYSSIAGIYSRLGQKDKAMIFYTVAMMEKMFDQHSTLDNLSEAVIGVIENSYNYDIVVRYVGILDKFIWACEQEGSEFLKSKLIFTKAKLLARTGNITQALELAKAESQNNESSLGIGVRNSEIKIASSQAIAEIYSIANIKDSVHYYDNKIKITEAELNREIEDLNRLDKSFQETLANNEIQREKAQKTYAILGAGAFIIAISVLGIVFYNVKMKSKNRQLINTSNKLTELARSKIHNIKSNYNSIRLMLENREFEKSVLYTSTSTRYMQLLLNSWNKPKWTIQDEIHLLEVFYNAEKIRRQNVQIQPLIAKDIDPSTTLFMPEVLTTLLHNAMKAFSNKQVIPTFTINITKEDQVLYFAISDNGTPSPKEKYLLKPNSGLSILYQRILIAFRLSKLKSGFLPHFEITPLPGQGTIIKFNYPYEQV